MMTGGKIDQSTRVLDIPRIVAYVLLTIGGTAGMAFLAGTNYLFFHVLAEIFSIVIAFAIFVLAWNTRRILQNGAILFLGVVTFFLGFIDLIHTMTYRGMGILAISGANEPTQLWIAGRYLQSVAFLAAPFLLNRRLNAYGLFVGCGVVTATLLISILVWPVFPDCYVEGIGLTQFKINSEYVISVLFAMSVLAFVRRREFLDAKVLRYILISIALTVAAEMSFTQYISVFGFANMFGHLVKLAASFLLYKGIVEIGLQRPYDLLFRDLKLQGLSLQKAHDVLEEHVRQRTEELQRVNAQLRREIDERSLAQGNLHVTNRMLQLLVKKSSQHEYLEAVIKELSELTGCRCIGIRVKDGTGEIPYEASQGFDADFLEQEGRLSELTTCACARVISGAARPEDAKNLSSFGSLHCADLANFLEGLPKDQRAQYRGHCAKVGFKTLVLVPVRYHGEIIGAIHIADEQPNRIARESLGLLEMLSPVIGEAAHRFAVEEELRSLNEELEARVEHRTRELADAHVATQARATELEAANKELESFSYTISHDLRSPLRAIDGFSRLIETDYAARLDDEGRRFISIIRNSVARMGQLIDDLLAFSRLGRQGIQQRPVDLRQIVQDLWQQMDPKLHGRDVELSVGEIPLVLGDPSMLRQVLQNLVGNSLKFTNRPDAKIDVFGWNEDHNVVCCVKDNGIGFDMKYAEKIFGVFQRLHRVEEYEGTGVGLAIVKRIVERHGGRVWAESEIGKGACICFALPQAPVDEGMVSMKMNRGEK